MPNKTQEYLNLAQQTAKELTRYWENWTDYLTTASRLYKYSYADQLMIYAQRPDATACASFDLWNDRMNRYIRRGSKGIALLDQSSSVPRLHYVFDVSDTGVRRNSRDPDMWQLGPDLVQPVSEMLAREYGVQQENLGQQIADICGRLVDSYWDNNSGDILDIVDGSLLMGYDEAGQEFQFKSAAAISITYAVLERCGFEPEGHFDRDDFQAIFSFSTPAAVYALGTAVSECSRELLRSIERTVKTTIRRRNVERSQYEYEQQERDLLESRRLSASEPDPAPAGESIGQVRATAPDLPDEASPGTVQLDAPVGNSASAPVGSGAERGEPDTADHAEAAGAESGSEQRAASDGVGAAHEQPESTGRGTGDERADLQLSFFDVAIPTEAEQIESIDQAESEKSPSAFSLSQADIENALRRGSNFENSKLRIWKIYQLQPDRNLRAKALAKEYAPNGPGGSSHTYLDGSRGWLDHDSKGLTFEHYPDHQKILLRWNQVEKYIDLMIQSDRYLSDKEKRIIDFPLELNDTSAAEYTALKEQYPDTLIGFEAGGNFMFYGEDAAKVAKIINSALFMRNTALGEVQITGFLPSLWAKRAKELWSAGNDVYLAGLNEDGTHHQTKHLRKEDYLPIGSVINMDDRKFRVDSVDFDKDKVSLQDMALADARMPIFREEPLTVVRELYEQQDEALDTAPEKTPDYNVGDSVVVDLPTRTIEGTIGYVGETDVRIDTNAQGYSWSNEVLNKQQFEDGLRQDEPELSDEELDKLPTSVEVNGEWQTFPDAAAADKALNAEPVPEAAGNFHITDDHLGEGGAKQKYARNVEAIRTLFQLEQEHRGATAEEQQVLSQYVGWGGLPDVFDPDKGNWAKEYSELKGLLSEDEYAAARSSVLNAHYTSPTVIRAIYDAVEKMGFRNGNILEPSMGIGNFFGMLPDTMQDSRLYGVELDSVTGRIAQKLYPDANIKVAGFETTDRRDFYDLAVGNVPFGQYRVNDKAYNKLGFSIHNYFFAKAIDQVRPGGIVAFVTSRYTLDSKDSSARKHIAERADLLGAIRLPNTAFKANAGTEVVSDIIFLQKRDRPIDHEPDWVQLGKTEDGFAINSYFVDHPEMVLGELTSESTQYGREECTVRPIKGAVLVDQLAETIQHIEGQFTEVEVETPDIADAENERHILPADPDVKNFSYTVVDGEVYYRENSVMTQVELSDTAKGRVTGMVELRQIVNELIDQQLNDYPDADIQATQEKLNAAYDAFSAKYGLLNDRKNGRLFEQDSSYYLLCSLENLDEQGRLKSKAAMFTKRTIRPECTVTNVDTPTEALAVSIGERGRVDLPYMAELLGTPGDYERITSELSGVIFKDPGADPTDPEAGWRMADEYLSGNVRAKLRMAQLAAETNPEFAVNVTALEKAQPKDLEASEIDVRLGATWLAPEIIQKFMAETFQIPYYLRHAVKVRYSPYTAEWRIEGKSAMGRGDIISSETYGTSRANAYKILEDTLNLKDVRIYDAIEDEEGKLKRILNKTDTMLAQQKQQVIKDAFANWIWKDPQRRIALVKQYNELFNSSRPREYDGSHIHLVGMNPEITLREHQRNAIAHVLYGGNTLLAHEVGAGKTFEMAASAMEAKRLGLCQKSLFVVPNHLTEQWASEFLHLYPNAKLLVARKKDFETANRKKFCARIATGDYDAVIIGHSQFERIPLSYERQERIIQEQIDETLAAIEELKANAGENFSIKQMEKTRKTLETKLEKLRSDARKDDVITFEQLGVDRLFVDESHFYKNLFLTTKMRNVAGLSTSEAQKSSDMFGKCRYLDEITGGRGVVFATGTPVSNSMSELYTVMRYLQYGTLQQKGLTHFDCWASTFGETTTAIELAPEGMGYRARTRFAKFFNLPELMSMFKEVADIKTSDQLHLPVPDAKFETVVAKPSEIQKEMVQELSKRAAKIHSGAVDASEDNMLCVTNDGRKIGLDVRLMNPILPDDPNSKLNTCVRNVLQIWADGKEQKLTQLLFCDLSTPKNDGNFNVYDDIRKKLVAAGVPESEVEFIHNADTEAKKAALFSKVRSGDVRILLGSTAKMGAGTNVQDRLIALHDLDCPWRPSDLQQRLGRIVRQGNQNPEVEIFRYVTEGTFDAYLYQLVESKQRFIAQIMTSKAPARAAEDVDETALSYAEIKALATGNPQIIEKCNLDMEVSKLNMLRASHLSQRYALEELVLRKYPAEIKELSERIAGYEQDSARLAEHPKPAEGIAPMVLNDVTYAERENAGKAIIEACTHMNGAETVSIGSYRGFSMLLSYDGAANEFRMVLKGKLSHTAVLGADAGGNVTRIDNALEKITEHLANARSQLAHTTEQLENARTEMTAPFPKEAELAEKTRRLNELNVLLNLNEQDRPVMADEPDEGDRIRPKNAERER